MSRRITALGIGLSLFFLAAWVTATGDSLQVALRLRSGQFATVSFDVSPGAGEVRQTPEQNSSFSNGTYQFDVSESGAGATSVLHLHIQREDNEPFELRGYSLSVHVPADRVSGIWFPSAPSSSTQVMAGDGSTPLNGIAEANEGIPYIAAASLEGQNIIAIGLANQELTVEITAEPVGGGHWIELRLYSRTSRTARTFDEYFYVSTDRSVDWFDAAADYTAWADEINGYRPMPVSARAYEPLYDVWYYAGDNVDDATYRTTAELAQEAGFGSFLADSGWDTTPGEYSLWLKGRTGDYDPPPDRFRNIRETFDHIRSAYKLSVQLWLQPFAVGRRSQRYPLTQDLHIQIPTNPTMPGWAGFFGEPFYLPLTPDSLENVNLCPRLSATHAYLQQLIQEIADKYKPDGYWFDFIDGMPSFCTAPHKHDVETFGEGLRLSLEAIRSVIETTTPGAVVQFRANYANLHNKPFANVWQAEDSPGDFDRMRLKTLRMRPFSKGVVFASDQLYWKPDLDDSEIARFVMTAVMTGVPAFGPDLTKMTASQREIVRAWMSFYRSVQPDLNYGRFHPFGLLPVPNHKIESPERTFVYLRNLNFPAVVAEADTIYLMNATDSDSIITDIQVRYTNRDFTLMTLDRFLNLAGVSTISPDENGVLHVENVVQKGGMAILIRASQ